MITVHVVSGVGGLVIADFEGAARRGCIYYTLEDLVESLHHLEVGDQEAMRAVGVASGTAMGATRGWSEMPRWVIPAIAGVTGEIQAANAPEKEIALGALGFHRQPRDCDERSGIMGYRGMDTVYACIVYRRWGEPARALASLPSTPHARYEEESRNLHQSSLQEWAGGTPWYVPTPLAEIILKRQCALADTRLF